jgi:hypothetical protein
LAYIIKKQDLMFGELKKILGIENVKIDLILSTPAVVDNHVHGIIKLSSLSAATVQSVTLKLIEKYYRGRSDSKRIDEYTIGFTELSNTIDVGKNDVIEIPFTLPYKRYQSEMDTMEQKNFLLGGLVKLAKKAKGVKSEYRIEAEAFVKGVKLNPIVKKAVEL